MHGFIRAVQVESSEGCTYFGAVEPEEGKGFLLHARAPFARKSKRERQRYWVSDSPKSFHAAAGNSLLVDDGGAHNLCFVTDADTHSKLCDVMGGTFECLKFAVGGQYLGDDANRPSPGYDGIYLYGLRKVDGAYQVQRCMFLVDGKHPGAIEKRAKCRGFAEYDGQSSLIFCNGAFRLFVRGNASAAGGYRSVLYATSPDLTNFSAFEMIQFPGVPSDANVYFAHPYRLGESLLLVMPLAFPDGHKQVSGIHAAVSHPCRGSGLVFETPMCLLPSAVNQCRTADVNAAGGIVDEDGMELILLVHRNVSGRTKQGASEDPESLEYWSFNLIHFSSGASEPTASPVPHFVAAGVPAAAGSSAVDSAADDQHYNSKWKRKDRSNSQNSTWQRKAHSNYQRVASRSPVVQSAPGLPAPLALGSGACEPTASDLTGDGDFSPDFQADSASDDSERSPAVQSAPGQPYFVLPASDVVFDELPIIVEARQRRNKCLKNANLDSATDLGHERVQVLWKEWQTEYCVDEHPHLAPNRRRGAFSKYCHKTIGARGEQILRAVLQTGQSADTIHSHVMDVVSARWNGDSVEKVQTCKSSLKTAAQKAKRARRSAQWVQNKAAIQAREWGLCARCYDRSEQQLRACQQCNYQCCTTCLQSDRLCRKCYKRGTPANDCQPMSSSMHPRAASLFNYARDGCLDQRAATLTSRVNSQRKAPTTAYDRFLKALLE
jgi:hypothetical protein